MSVKPPFTDLDIQTQDGGFYEGYSLPIALISKISMVLLVLWALIFPLNAGSMLSSINSTLLQSFNTFYILAVGAFAFFLFAIALIPSTGKRVLGTPGQKPEFSNFSWFSMMFGAGLGVGLMTFATAEPLGLWGSNPVLLSSDIAPNTPEALQSGYRYTFAHYGFHAWAIYVVTGLSLAYYAYTRGMPLTIRSALTPLIGKYANGFFGHVIDVLGVVATILGVSVTIGFGVSQLVDGAYAITGAGWLMDTTGDTPTATKAGLITALVMIMALSILSAVSGVGRGVKWLSNINLVLSLILLLTFVIFGSFLFAMTTYASAFVDYILNFISLSFAAHGPVSADMFASTAPAAVQALEADQLATVYGGATNAWGSFGGFTTSVADAGITLSEADLAAAYAAGTEGRLFNWQAGWTTFYWAWWIAFSPFVGLFLARISKGRSVREFVLGAVIAPSLVCFAWMTILGGTAIDLELSGTADGAIIAASNSAKLFVTLEQMLSGGVLQALIVMCVVLIMTFLVTSADSGILVMNTIMSGGAEETGVKHRIIWGVILTLVIGTLLLAGGGGLSALQNAMIIGALPFTMVMVGMVLALIKALYNDGRRDSAGIATDVAGQPAE
ncbi:BCCT family transporter [Sulfitobacter mediterraneus]|uniref:BCCT family transporter n=1 Tax=Sulfitobacter TaxID=60136 RepID=UPI0019346B64|nr:MULTISPECIES: BCCT family transporter [Sulfitobacter]MBM1632181.1 BCCT family transporter [Sulfitobacter mediterraneus]MBM1639997.1 BCCT family transporter [Sulfitobacter mediterraneus]MBM1644046.1 BCCT family transporter [Sulfitobacter mediterraneus]MBM1648092.1 BCCT family transporter [Sulfitobacter mediterraneus]MBM1652137.1 BCCT family transporter [Sulfitobacter mediterraneus]